MRILLVEDDEILAKGLRKALVRSGYAVDWLADGATADAALKTEAFDLVVLDLTLPGLDGFKLLQRIRARSQAVPVLITTARSSVSDRVCGTGKPPGWGSLR